MHLSKTVFINNEIHAFDLGNYIKLNCIYFLYIFFTLFEVSSGLMSNMEFCIMQIKWLKS